MENEQYSASVPQAIQHAEILDAERYALDNTLDLSTMDRTLNLTLDSDQCQSEKFERSASSPQPLRSSKITSPQSKEFNAHESLTTVQDLGSHDSFHVIGSSVSSLRRGTRSHRRSVQQTEPNNLNLLLELLPCILGFIWIANVYFGNR
jgi:hypothetical protein